MILSDALITTLADLGVSHIFSVSGANIELIHDAVHRLCGNKLQTVLCKSESGAAFMADGFARKSQSLGVCSATSGGGMMNLAAGIAESQTQGIPVFAIIGQIPKSQEGIGGFQDSSGQGGSINALAMWQAITKYSCKIETAENFWQYFHECLSASINGKQGASAMLIPRDLMSMEVGPKPNNFLASLTPQPYELTEHNQQQINRATDLLKQAKRPIAILGEAVARSSAYEPLKQWLKSCHIHTTTTLANIAAFDHQHPLYLGTVGITGHPSTHLCLQEADLIIAIGTTLDVMSVGPLHTTLAQQPLIVINPTLQALDPALNAQVKIEADFAPVLEALKQQLPTLSSPTTFKNAALTKQPALLSAEKQQGLRQSQALATINTLLPEGGHLLFDAGNCAAAAAHYLDAPPHSQASIALGMGGMGYGVAAAIGVALAQQKMSNQKDKHTTVFCGDGAFLMNGFEVHTAVELQLPILWIVFNNNKHGMCVTRQQTFLEHRIECSEFSKPISISQISRGLAKSQDLTVACASNTEEIKHFLQGYWQQEQRGPAVLELMITVDEIPPFIPFINAHRLKQTQAKAESVE